MNGLVLVAGATGYVGERLWRRLEADGRGVRCLGRLAQIVV
ncbi:NAD-dependent epimerase/dehydratase family protein [Candidatus Methylomirabilis sp.]